MLRLCVSCFLSAGAAHAKPSLLPFTGGGAGFQYQPQQQQQQSQPAVTGTAGPDASPSRRMQGAMTGLSLDQHTPSALHQRQQQQQQATLQAARPAAAGTAAATPSAQRGVCVPPKPMASPFANAPAFMFSNEQLSRAAGRQQQQQHGPAGGIAGGQGLQQAAYAAAAAAAAGGAGRPDDQQSVIRLIRELKAAKIRILSWDDVEIQYRIGDGAFGTVYWGSMLDAAVSLWPGWLLLFEKSAARSLGILEACQQGVLFRTLGAYTPLTYVICGCFCAVSIRQALCVRGSCCDEYNSAHTGILVFQCR